MTDWWNSYGSGGDRAKVSKNSSTTSSLSFSPRGINEPTMFKILTDGEPSLDWEKTKWHNMDLLYCTEVTI